MGITNNVFKELIIKKGGRIGTPNTTKASNVNNPLSPLLTNFEKWSDKRKKLYFSNENAMKSKGLKDFQLKDNVFASLIASPMRCEKITRIKAPKDLLIQLKLKKLQNHHNGKYRLELVPMAEHSKLNKSSYVVNSKNILRSQIRSATSWIPTPALISNMRYFNVSDVEIDKENFLKNYVEGLQQLIEDGLNSMGALPSIPELCDGDVVVSYDKENLRNFEILRLKSSEGNNKMAALFNLACLEDEKWAQLIIEKFKNHNMGIVLNLTREEKLIKRIYNLLTYLST